MIELLFEIATKIRLDPDVLPAWFYPERGQGQSRASSSDARRSQFPLFYILVDYVHYDGPIGDFARTALLYLTETASRSRPLENWMLESDLAPQMASGLSALYSRLSRRQSSIKKEALPILGHSDLPQPVSDVPDAVEDSEQNTRAFLSYLAFWEDTLNHCKSVEVRDTLLDHFQVLFVQQLLYPSLLESSDVEGGSTAAVILHLCRILDAVDHQQMINRMLRYLFGTRADSGPRETHRARQRMSMSRRKSVEQLASLAMLADNPSPELFNLLDLICFSLRSSHAQTVTSSLRLVSTLLNRHHHHIAKQLFSLRAREVSEDRQDLKSLNHAMMTFFDLAHAIAQQKSIDESYQAALADAQVMLERHCCLIEDGKKEPPLTLGEDVEIITSDCKVFHGLIDLLNTWFANDTLVNLELTGAFTALAACQHVSLRAWLSPVNDQAVEERDEVMNVTTVLKSLIEQAKDWRQQFVEWDAFYSVQRFRLASEDERAGQAVAPSMSVPTTSRSKENTPSSSPRIKSRKVVDMGSIDSRLANSPKVGASPGQKDLPPSPLQQLSFPHEEQNDDGQRSISSDSLSTTLLQTQIPLGLQRQDPGPDGVASDATEETAGQGGPVGALRRLEGGSGVATGSGREEGLKRTASLGHILTQAIILQEFILELAAILQIRATLFDEVDLS